MEFLVLFVLPLFGLALGFYLFINHLGRTPADP
jgi:hypothetical protein